LQLHWLEPTPLFELALQGLHAATLPPENDPAAQSAHPVLKSFTRWPAGHTSVHVEVRPYPPYVCAAHVAHPVSAVLPHGGRNCPGLHEVVVHA